MWPGQSSNEYVAYGSTFQRNFISEGKNEKTAAAGKRIKAVTAAAAAAKQPDEKENLRCGSLLEIHLHLGHPAFLPSCLPARRPPASAWQCLLLPPVLMSCRFALFLLPAVCVFPSHNLFHNTKRRHEDLREEEDLRRRRSGGGGITSGAAAPLARCGKNEGMEDGARARRRRRDGRQFLGKSRGLARR